MIDDPSRVQSNGRLACALFVAQFVLIWTTFFILSDAIGWPASLNDAADIALPRLLAHKSAVLVGYGSYLLAAILLVPATAALASRLGVDGAKAAVMMALAILSSVAKSIGIARWLFAMPVLAELHVTAGADKPAISLAFDLLNAYAGGIGEVLGVALFTGILTISVGMALLRIPGRAATIIGCYAMVAGILLLLNIPARFGVEMPGLLTLSNVAWQFSLLAVGLWSLILPAKAGLGSARGTLA